LDFGSAATLVLVAMIVAAAADMLDHPFDNRK
jgi:hypothetical protein